MSVLGATTTAWLRTIVEDGPTPLFATISGAHLYGFESPDSDYDLRGAYVEPLRNVLRLREARETVERMEDCDGKELDWVAHDVKKFVRLMTKRNGYVLEQLYSPLVVFGGEHFDELRALGAGCIIAPLFHHYAGFAKNQRQLLERGEHTVKRLLYCYRVLCTGIHVLQTGRIEANLRVLATELGALQVEDLMERKRAGAEYAALRDGEAATHTAALDALTARLDAAHESCTLPSEVTNFDALDDFVVRTRMELGDE